MAEAFYNNGVTETPNADTSVAGKEGNAGGASGPLDDEFRRVEPGSTGQLADDRPADGSVAPGTGSAREYPADEGARGGRPVAADAPPPSSATPGGALRSPSNALVSNGESFRARWSSVQVGFVDDPRRAVEEAEQLVTDVISDLVDGFRRRRKELETDEGGSTDEMRTAFQGYRDFFDRLLNV